jgi:ABC-type uncharacterized transport system ATPase subunit
VVDLEPDSDERVSHLSAGALGFGGTVELLRSDGPRHWLTFDRERVNPAQLVSAVAASHAVRDVAIEEPEIEDIVRLIYEQGIGG